MPAPDRLATLPDCRVDIGVALCSHRGAEHLAAQLESIDRQSVESSIEVHDDASNDGTVALARTHPSAPSVIAHTRNVGVVANFERALQSMLSTDTRYIALADQDDIWDPQRLELGVIELQRLEATHGSDIPLLVHSDLRMVDTHGRPIAESFLRFRGYATGPQCNLAVMLGQCGVMGNTCLVNRALLQVALPFPQGLHVHDWWLGLIAELYGARGFIDRPLVDYRIHRDNVSNSIDALDGGAGRLTASRLCQRDFRLPFKEDSRIQVLRALLDGDGHRRVPQGDARRTIERFASYLAFDSGRLHALWTLLAGGYARPGWRHRVRVAAALLTTARYR